MHELKSRPHAARLGAGAAALALAAASAVAVSTPAAAATPEDGTNSASGIAAEGTLLNVKPRPHVQSDGQPQHDQIAEIPASPLVDAKMFKVHANKAQAHATAVDASLLAGNLTAEVIKAKCVNGKADAVVANLRLAGQKLTLPDGAPISTHPEPNTTIQVPPEQLSQLEQVGDVTLTLNKQAETDGGGVQVTALEIKADLVGGAVTQTVVVSSAKCDSAGGSSTEPPSYDDGPKDDGPDNGGPSKAPKPTPVTGNLPVTG